MSYPVYLLQYIAFFFTFYRQKETTAPPHQKERGRKMVRTGKTIGLAIGHTGFQLESSCAAIADGVFRQASQFGWEVIDLRSWHWNAPPGKNLDGLICDASSELELLKDVPFSVNIGPKRKLRTNCGVTTDQAALGQMAATYFIERGFRNFGLAAYQMDDLNAALTAFKAHIEKYGGVCQTILGMHLPGSSQATEVRNAVGKQLKELTTPLGIFCTNDRLAVRLCQLCIDYGLSVPEQAAIMGAGNDPIACQSGSVPLSSIDMDYRQHGMEAALLLKRLMDGESIPKGTISRLPPKEIVTRRSTDIMAVPDTHVAHALRYIWDHYRKPVTPDQIAAYCAVPRRSLERRFKKELGRPLMKEVMHRRLSKASDLLINSQMLSADIAAYAGFATQQYFNFQFKKKFGLSPRAYRNSKRRKHNPGS
jgi:LacI family transcriptional regulator